MCCCHAGSGYFYRYFSKLGVVEPTAFKFFFFTPWAYCYIIFPVQALYPEPRTRLYEICIYLHCSSLRALNCRLVQAYETPNSCGEGLLSNLFRVRPIPTGYSLCALNPLLPGLEPGPAQSTLTELHCWC